MPKSHFFIIILLTLTGAIALSMIAFGLGRFAGFGEAEAAFQHTIQGSIKDRVDADILKQELSECRAANANR